MIEGFSIWRSSLFHSEKAFHSSTFQITTNRELTSLLTSLLPATCLFSNVLHFFCLFQIKILSVSRPSVLSHQSLQSTTLHEPPSLWRPSTTCYLFSSSYLSLTTSNLAFHVYLFTHNNEEPIHTPLNPTTCPSPFLPHPTCSVKGDGALEWVSGRVNG